MVKDQRSMVAKMHMIMNNFVQNIPKTGKKGTNMAQNCPLKIGQTSYDRSIPYSVVVVLFDGWLVI